jgi:hypothetical protein
MNITPRLSHFVLALVTLLTTAAPTWAQALEWVRAVGTGNADAVSAVAVDNTANVYVGGSTSGTFAGQGSAGEADAFVARFDASGNMLWVRQFGTSGPDGVNAVGTDAAGFVYVAGSITGQGLLAKYDSMGTQKWLRQFTLSGFGTVGIFHLGADRTGNTYLLGAASDPAVPPPVAGPRFFLTRYDAEGAQVWFQWLASATLIPNTYQDLVTDDPGHAYLLGLSRAPSPSSFDRAFLDELDETGTRVQWPPVDSRIAPYPIDVHSYFYAVAADELGNIYLAGSAVPRSGSWSYFLIRYDAARSQVWVQPMTGEVIDLAADARGVYVAIGSSLAMYDPSGARLWETPLISRIGRLAVARGGDIYAALSGAYLAKVANTVPPVEQHFEIVSRASGKCLDVFGASTDAAAQVIQWSCHGGQNQQWRLEPAGGGAFRIIARHSGQVLDVFGALVDDVTPVIQYPVHGGENQLWAIEPTSAGYVRIIARHSGKAIDVEGASLDDGAWIIQYTPHGGTNQEWFLRNTIDANQR